MALQTKASQTQPWQSQASQTQPSLQAEPSCTPIQTPPPTQQPPPPSPTTPPTTEFTADERITLRGLRRENAVSRLLTKVPRPHGAVPANAPEEWHYLALDQMMPMYKWPADSAIAFSRQKIGREIYASNDADFDLSDPYCRTVSYEYQPLHDHHLRRLYEKQPRLRQALCRKGLISEDDDVVCTLKEFNEYRQFLKRLYTMQVNRTRAQQDEENMDRLRFEWSELRAKKNAELFVRHEAVDENRRKYREAMKMDMTNAAERQKILMSKYYATIARFEQLTDAKRRDLRERMHEKEQHALERRNQLRLFEKRRIILMHRKFALENGLVRQRRRLILLRKRRMYDEEIRTQWDRHTEFRTQCKMRDEQLQALDQEMRTYRVMQRNQSVQKSYERDQHQILMTRARLVLERYPGRTKEDMVKAMISEIQRVLKFQLAEEVQLAKSSSAYVEVEESSLQSNASPKGSSVKTLPKSSKLSVKLSEKSMQIQSDTYRSIKKSNSTQSARSKTIPYEPEHLTSVGLIDNIKGYGKLTEADIRRAVEGAYDTMVSLNQQISAHQVLSEANVNLLRICKGYVNDIPRDDAVVECVRKRVSKMLERVQQKFVDRVLEAHANEFENAPTREQILEEFNKAPREIDLQFGETEAIGASAYAHHIKSVKPTRARKSTPTTPVRTVARNVLVADDETNAADDPRILEEDMQQRSIAHLYDFQKVMILDNLDRFEQKLEERLEAVLRKGVNFKTCTFAEPPEKDKVLTKDEEDKLTSQITDTVLTLPEKDTDFGKRILNTTDTLAPPILSKIQTELDTVHAVIQRQSVNESTTESVEPRLCGCYGQKAKAK